MSTAVELPLEFFPCWKAACDTALHSTVVSKERLRNIQRVLHTERAYITFSYTFAVFVFAEKRSLYVFSSNSFCNQRSYGYEQAC